jgi:hypothetical protein
MSNPKSARRRTMTRLVAVAACLVVAVASFALSYVALREVAVAVGAVPASMGWLVPIVIDGGIICGSAVIWSLSKEEGGRPRFPFFFVALMVVMSVVVNVAHAGDSVLAKVIAALPPLILLGTLELVAAQSRREQGAGAPEDVESTGSTQAPAPVKVEFAVLSSSTSTGSVSAPSAVREVRVEVPVVETVVETVVERVLERVEVPVFTAPIGPDPAPAAPSSGLLEAGLAQELAEDQVPAGPAVLLPTQRSEADLTQSSVEAEQEGTALDEQAPSKPTRRAPAKTAAKTTRAGATTRTATKAAPAKTAPAKPAAKPASTAAAAKTAAKKAPAATTRTRKPLRVSAATPAE